jgi:outer membrane protein assembly factor BamB
MRENSALLFIIFLFVATVTTAQKPTQWRGEGSTGIYNDTGLLKSWPASGPEIIWQSEGLGDGHSSPVFANGKIYLSGALNGIGHIFCLNPDGKLNWKVPYGEEWTESYPGSRSTPVIDGNSLYIYSGKGVITCMDVANGSVKWKKDVLKELGGKNITWGVNETMVIDGEKLFVTPGGPVNNIVALNKKDGSLIWSCKAEGEPSAYCTPLLVKLPSRKLLVTHTEKHIIGVDAENGKFLWSMEWSNQWAVHANTPLYLDRALFCFSGYGQGGMRLNLNEDGSQVTKAWYNEKADNRIGGAVLINGYIYLAGDKTRDWQCIDWKTGEQKYSSKVISQGSVIYADGMLYCYGERGDLALVEAKPESFNIISKTKLTLGGPQHWAHLVINDGKLYLRHDGYLICYKVK